MDQGREGPGDKQWEQAFQSEAFVRLEQIDMRLWGEPEQHCWVFISVLQHFDPSS